MQLAVLGIDLGKNKCSIVGLNSAGAVVLRRRLRREGVIEFTTKLKSCVVAMEACCGSHHLGRVLRAQGHEVRLMSPEYVRAYVKSQKNDDRDAEAIAEAATRPTMRFVELKNEEQLDIAPSLVDRIKQTLVGLKMPRAIEILDVISRRLDHGEITAIEAIDALLAEELTLRENRRIKIALMMARLSSIKTLAGFDFSFQPSLDKNRIMALAELEFIERREVVMAARRRASSRVSVCRWLVGRCSSSK